MNNFTFAHREFICTFILHNFNLKTKFTKGNCIIIYLIKIYKIFILEINVLFNFFLMETYFMLLLSIIILIATTLKLK